MLVIGLTGGIGCGKSLVADRFHRLFEVPVIDADIITKQLSQTKEVVDSIYNNLDREFVDKNHQLIRKRLRQAIFSNTDLRKKLEKIMHPLVYDEINRQLSKLNRDYCMISIPLLLETKRTNFIDRVLVVDCTVAEQVSRVMRRDQCSQQHAENIIAIQMERANRLALADDVIENSGTIHAIEAKVITLHEKYTRLSKF